MKYLIVLFFASVELSQALACSPPPDLTYIQPGQISAVMDSQIVISSLRSAGGKDIESVSRDPRGYRVRASNGCYVVAAINYIEPTHPGMCPSLANIEVLTSACN